MTTTVQQQTVQYNAAQKVAALSAIRDGIDAIIDEEKQNVIQFATQHGVKSFATTIGNVTVTSKKQSIRINRKALIKDLQTTRPELLTTYTTITEEGVAWLREHMPQFVVDTIEVSDGISDAIQSSLTVVDGQIVDPNGTIVDYATLGPEPTPYVTLPASTNKKEAIKYATQMIQANLTGFVTPVLEA